MTPSAKIPNNALLHSEDEDHHEWCPRLDRRAAVRLLGLTTLASAVGCGSSSSLVSTTGGTTATTTTLKASASTVATATNITLTATVSPSAATGTITFYSGSTAIGTATLSSGTAALTTSFSSAGTETLTAVYSGSSTYAASTSSAVTLTVTASSSTGTASCSETLEGEEGPYFIDDSDSGYNRVNILSNLDGSSTQTGIPLALTIYIYDAKNGCAPLAGVQVDIWHCNAQGVYSDESSESTVGQSWLRGYQLTDSTGMVQFTTIMPGWYSGRTTHIHFRLRSTYDESSTGGTNTMQIFFDQTTIDTIDTTIAPYSSEGQNPTTNASDRVYSQQEDGTTLVTLSGSTSAGFTTTANAYLPI